METFKRLSDRLGGERVILRVDPILIAEGTGYTVDYHLREFERICAELSSYTESVVISFIDSYKKISKKMKRYGIREPDLGEMMMLGENFASIAKCNGFSIGTCAEAIGLSRFGVAPAKCIDPDLIERIIGARIKNKDAKDASRKLCGCIKSMDIGQYDTCVHGCVYCYANINDKKSAESREVHDPSLPLLSGGLNGTAVKLRNAKDM